MRPARTVLLVLAIVWPLAAGAVEVKFGAETDAVYDNNVFRTSDDKKQDVSFRMSPSVAITEQTDKFSTTLLYKPTYEAFTTYTDANDLSHYLYNSMAYRFSPATEAKATNLFRVMSLLNYGDAEPIEEGTTPIPDNDIERDQVLLYDSSLKLTHAITPRWSSDSDIAFDLFDPQQRRNTVASRTASAFQNFQYAYDRSNLFGVGGGAVIQMFDQVNSVPASNTYIFRIFGTYQRHFGESTTLTVRAGPAFIMTKQDKAEKTESATYPFYRVGEDTTVGGLRGRNIFIVDPYGQSLSLGTPVAAGSVVVPNPGSCVVAPAGLTGTVLFDPNILQPGNPCAARILLRSDVASGIGAPGDDLHVNSEQDAAALVQDENSTVEVQGSNQGSDDSTISIFGDITLEHYWTPNLISTLNYNRSESSASGLGASTIADSAYFITVWRPSPLWDLSLRGSYVKRESPTNLSRTFIQVTRDTDPLSTTFGLVQSNGASTVSEESNAIDTQRWEVAARVARRMTRHISVSLWAAYSDQTSSNTDRNPNQFGDFTAILGFKYDFDPFRF